MKHLIIICLILLLAPTATNAQKNNVTGTYKVLGNCETCKHSIEKAANKKGQVKSSWDQNSKILTVSYDNTKTNADEILKRVAYAGYDNEKFLAPESAYAKLPGCCQYQRTNLQQQHKDHDQLHHHQQHSK